MAKLEFNELNEVTHIILYILFLLLNNNVMTKMIFLKVTSEIVKTYILINLKNIN